MPEPEARYGRVAWTASPRRVNAAEGWDHEGRGWRMERRHLSTWVQRERSLGILGWGGC